jgi:hypothetical protein
VAVSVQPVQQYAADRDGDVGIEVRNHGPALAKVTVTLQFTVAQGHTVSVARQAGKGKWPAVPLSRNGSSLNGSWTTALPKGTRTLHFRLRPHYAPAAFDEKLPVHVVLADRGAPIAIGSADATLATLLATWKDGPHKLAVHRDGRWTEVALTLRNPSRLDIPQVDVRPAYDTCPASGTCQGTGRDDLADDFRIAVRDGGDWVGVDRAKGAAPATGAVVSVPLPAGASRTVHLRIAATGGLPASATRADFRLLATGTLKGAPSPSLALCDTELDLS